MYKGKKYFNDGNGWFGSNYLAPAESVINSLDALLKEKHNEETKKVEKKNSD